MKKFYQVIRDGQIIGTRSSDRDYTHAIVLFKNWRWVRDEKNPEAAKNNGYVKQPVEEYALKITNYAGSFALAQKAANREAKSHGACRFEILPVTVLEKKPSKKSAEA